MNIILMNIGFSLMTVGAVALYVCNRRLIKALRKASDSLKEANEKLKEANEKLKTSREHELEYLDSIHNRVVVVERTGYFSIFRESKSGRILITRYYYDPNDPDDREYIRIHAEEVAEKLNEKP